MSICIEVSVELLCAVYGKVHSPISRAVGLILNSACHVGARLKEGLPLPSVSIGTFSFVGGVSISNPVWLVPYIIIGCTAKPERPYISVRERIAEHRAIFKGKNSYSVLSKLPLFRITLQLPAIADFEGCRHFS